MLQVFGSGSSAKGGSVNDPQQDIERARGERDERFVGRIQGCKAAGAAVLQVFDSGSSAKGGSFNDLTRHGRNAWGAR